MIPVTGHTLEGQQVGFQIARYADSCPICHTSVHPKQIAVVVNAATLPQWAQIVFECTRNDCRRLFIATYHAIHGPKPGVGPFEFVSSAPTTPTRAAFDPEIGTLSPTFVEVFNQSIAAEDGGLDQLTGIGLRKALEFLVKDFSVAQHPTQRDAIFNSSLSACIQNYIDDANAKACASRAAWLGNDETHYLRKWEDKDVGDLKILIRLTVNWIENVLLTRRYVSELPDSQS